MPLADMLARRYARGREPLEDLVQVARVGLVKAAGGWDAERGTRFSTYAVPTILGELRRHFRDRTWAVRPPRALQDLYLECLRARDQLLQDLGRHPSLPDVAMYLGRDVEDIVEAMEAGRGREPQSLDAPIAADRRSGSTYCDVIEDPRSEITRLEGEVTFAQLSAGLRHRDREVVRLRFQEDLMQAEIAERLGCSQMEVSRTLRRALRRLAEMTDPGSRDNAERAAARTAREGGQAVPDSAVIERLVRDDDACAVDQVRD